MTASSDKFDLRAAPLRIGTVTLRARDLPGVADFYQRILGLNLLGMEAERAVLGGGGEPLLFLKGDPALAPPDPRQAGLFHTAFLLPSRADLARWLAHAARTGIRLQGASDHIVSEALYLADPEGNGIEVYADRPAAEWQTPPGTVRMATDPLDLDALRLSAGDTRWTGFPEGGCIGHVHLRVGETGTADRFYSDILGLDIAARYPGASFYGSGGYHHQLAGNVWNSRGAGARPAWTAGLAELTLITREPGCRDAILRRANKAGTTVTTTAHGPVLHDPWGTRVALGAD